MTARSWTRRAALGGLAALPVFASVEAAAPSYASTLVQQQEKSETSLGSASSVNAGDYFAKAGLGSGDGKDVTRPLQDAVDEAIRTNAELVIPPPEKHGYYLTSTITIRPASGQKSTSLSIRSAGPFFTLTYKGPSGTSAHKVAIIRSIGWKRAAVDGLQIRFAPDVSNCVAFDLDVSATAPSSGLISWRNCHVASYDTTRPSLGCVGWRFGHTGGRGVAGSEMSMMSFVGCSVSWGRVRHNSGRTGIGWVNEHANSLNHTWVNCGAVGCQTAWSNSSTVGAGDSSGGSALYFLGCASTLCEVVFNFVRGGQYAVSGGRHELGGALLHASTMSSDLVMVMTVENLLCSEMEGTDGALFQLRNTAGVLSLRGIYAQPPVGRRYDHRLITLHCGKSSTGQLSVDACALGSSGVPYRVQQGRWTISLAASKHMTVRTSRASRWVGRDSGNFLTRLLAVSNK